MFVGSASVGGPGTTSFKVHSGLEQGLIFAKTMGALFFRQEKDQVGPRPFLGSSCVVSTEKTSVIEMFLVVG